MQQNNQSSMTNVKRIIRKAVLPEDEKSIMEIFAQARGIMRASGNMSQWGEGYPSLDGVSKDVAREGAFVVEDDGLIVAYFAFLPSPEPTYSKIYNGKWLNDTESYHVIHRIASYPDVHGIFSNVMDYCFSHESNVRIDTHRDNTIMQHNIERHGFTYCGIIYLASGDERLAYQRVVENEQ